MRRLRVVECVMTLLCLLCPLVLMAGPLSPPDPPAPTMKTIEQAAPGFPITQADIPLTITEPGYYYFAENISVDESVLTAILVEAQNVTIDLRGFALRGAGKNLVGPIRIGIGAGFPARNTRVTNGSIVEFATGAVVVSTNSIIEDLRIVNVGDAPLSALSGSIIRNNSILTSGPTSSSGYVIRGDRSIIEGNTLTFCSGNNYLIASDPDGIVRNNVLLECNLIALGPPTADLDSVNISQIPSFIHVQKNGVIEGNVIKRCTVPNNSNWHAAISTNGGSLISGNSVEILYPFGRSIGIACGSDQFVTPQVLDNIVFTNPAFTDSEMVVGIWMKVADGVVSGNKLAMSGETIFAPGSSPKNLFGILLSGNKNSVSDNKLVVDRRADVHAGIRVLSGRNRITGNEITSHSVVSFNTFTAISFEGNGSSGSSSNYYAGNIMEGVIFEEAGGGTSNIEGTTPAPNVIY